MNPSNHVAASQAVRTIRNDGAGLTTEPASFTPGM